MSPPSRHLYKEIFRSLYRDGHYLVAAMFWEHGKNQNGVDVTALLKAFGWDPTKGAGKLDPETNDGTWTKECGPAVVGRHHSGGGAPATIDFLKFSRYVKAVAAEFERIDEGLPIGERGDGGRRGEGVGGVMETDEEFLLPLAAQYALVFAAVENCGEGGLDDVPAVEEVHNTTFRWQEEEGAPPVRSARQEDQSSVDDATFCWQEEEGAPPVRSGRDQSTSNVCREEDLRSRISTEEDLLPGKRVRVPHHHLVQNDEMNSRAVDCCPGDAAAIAWHRPPACVSPPPSLLELDDIIGPRDEDTERSSCPAGTRQ